MKSFNIDISYFQTGLDPVHIQFADSARNHGKSELKAYWRTSVESQQKTNCRLFLKSRGLANGLGICFCSALLIYEFHVFSCAFFFTQIFSSFPFINSIQFVLFGLKRILNRRAVFFSATISLFAKKKYSEYIGIPYTQPGWQTITVDRPNSKINTINTR